MFIILFSFYTAISLLPGDIHLDLHESIMHLYIYSPFTEESSYSVWEPHSDAPAKFHMSSPVQLWFKMKRRAGPAVLKDIIHHQIAFWGQWDLHSFKAQISISIFCSVELMYVANRSTASLSIGPVPSSHHLLAWNPGDLVSPHWRHTCCHHERSAGPQTPGHYTYLNPAHFNLVWTLPHFK